MAETITMTLHDSPDIKELLELLKSSGFQAQRKEYESLLNGVDAIVEQYGNILTELDTLKEKVGRITDREAPLRRMVENLGKLAAGIGEKLKNLKDGILSFTKNALDTVKEKGLSALAPAFSFLHVKDGLKAMGKGLAKSAEGLHKAAGNENGEAMAAEEKTADEAPAASLSERLADMWVDFENLAPEELEAAYGKLLAIGMDNGLTAKENQCLQNLVDEAGELLPGRGRGGQAPETEAVAGQDVEM